MMRSFWKALILWSCTVSLHAQRIDIKPLDFEPLTSLPWKETPKASLEDMLKRIFLESDPAIRYPVLAAYLRQIPAEQLDSAFDHCIRLEGTQRPQNLIAFFLPIWAERAPHAAWKRTEPLFKLQDTGWLSYDSWRNEKMVFRNLEAMLKSSFWIDPRWLENFLAGLNRSQLPPDEKKSLRDAFMARWSSIYDSPPSDYFTGGYELESPSLIEAFQVSPDRIPDEIRRSVEEKRAVALRVLLRRWLVRQPGKAVLVATIAEKLGEAQDELFLLWLRHAPDTLVEWTEAHFNLKDRPFRVMGMLMSHVDEKRRRDWISRVQGKGADENSLNKLICNWACWDPKSGLKAAMATGDSAVIREAADSTVCSGFNVINALHQGLHAVRDHDVGSLPKSLREEVLHGYGVQIMEQWGDVDVGEAARYGLDFMLKTDYAPRMELIKLFAGDDAFHSGSDMIDRTFCALRMWAALQPQPMKAWIATQPDPEMRKALTWLLEHPWGTGKP